VDEFYFSRAVLQDERRLGEGLLGAFDVGLVEVADVFALLFGGVPAPRLVTVHLVDDAAVGEGGGAGGGPCGVAVAVVAVGVGVEDIAHWLGRERGHESDELFGAGGVVGVNDDEVVRHLDDDGVGVAFGGVAEKEPDAGCDEDGRERWSDGSLRCEWQSESEAESEMEGAAHLP